MSAPPREKFLAWLKSAEGKNYYELLRLRRDANGVTVKEQFHKFALVFHPDRYVEEELDIQSVAAEVFKRGVEAYRVLSRPPLRAKYDQQLAQGQVKFDDRAVEKKPERPERKRFADIARSARAKELAAKADRFVTIGQLEQARIQLTNAIQCEPDNAELSAQLRVVYDLIMRS